MTKEAFFKSTTFKVLFILLIAVSIIKLFSSGYQAGKWLYQITH